MNNTVHIKLIFLKTLISLFLIGPVFATGPIKFSIFDSGFCPTKLPNHPLIKIQNVMDVTKTNPNYDCTLPETNHGFKVLKTIIENYKGLKVIEIYPFNIFDKSKNQSIEYWKLALKLSEDNLIPTVVSATGVPMLKKIDIKPNDFFRTTKLFILASGRKEGKLQKMEALFPQDYLPKKNKKIIGSQIKFQESTLKDPQTHHPENVDIWIDELPNEPFSGSSRAVANFVAQMFSK